MIKIISPWFIRNFRERLTGYKVSATTFLPFVVIFRDEKAANNADTVNHEAIHGRQMVECLLIGTILLSVWFKFFTGNNAFEREAHENAKYPNYLKTRKPYAWRKYL